MYTKQVYLGLSVTLVVQGHVRTGCVYTPFGGFSVNLIAKLSQIWKLDWKFAEGCKLKAQVPVPEKPWDQPLPLDGSKRSGNGQAAATNRRRHTWTRFVQI